MNKDRAREILKKYLSVEDTEVVLNDYETIYKEAVSLHEYINGIIKEIESGTTMEGQLEIVDEFTKKMIGKYKGRKDLVSKDVIRLTRSLMALRQLYKHAKMDADRQTSLLEKSRSSISEMSKCLENNKSLLIESTSTITHLEKRIKKTEKKNEYLQRKNNELVQANKDLEDRISELEWMNKINQTIMRKFIRNSSPRID